MELNSHPSCSAPPISARELSNCVCVRARVCTWCPCDCLLHQAASQGLEIGARVTLSSSIAHLSFQQLLLLVSAVCGCISPSLVLPLIYGRGSPGRPLRRGLRVCSPLCLSDTPHALCQLSFHISDMLELLAAVNSHHWPLLFYLPLSPQPCQSSQSFAMDAVDSLVRCGILVIEAVRYLLSLEMLHNLMF